MAGPARKPKKAPVSDWTLTTSKDVPNLRDSAFSNGGDSIDGKAVHPSGQPSSKSATEHFAIPSKHTKGSSAPAWVLKTYSRGHGLGSGAIPDAEYLIDDSGPVEQFKSDLAAEKETEKLKARFVQRFAHMSECRVTITDAIDRDSMTIRLMGDLSDEQKKLVKAIDGALKGISYMEDAYVTRRSENELRTAIYSWYRHRTQECVISIRMTFAQHKSLFEDILATLSGVFEYASSNIDRELGDLITELQSRAYYFAKDSNEDEYALVQLALNMCQLNGFGTRLKALLNKSAFSQQLYLGTSALCNPELALGTFVRLMQILAESQNVQVVCTWEPENKGHESDSKFKEMQWGLPSSPKDPHFLPQSSSIPSQTWTIIPSKRISSFNAALKPVEYPANNMFLQAHEYLFPADRKLGLLQLQPEAKQHVFLLLSALIRRQNPYPNWPGYYEFGYVACRNDKEIQLLGGLWHAILTDPDCGTRTEIFEKLWQALEANSLVRLVEYCGYLDSLRSTIPKLENFLCTPRNERPSVWRLIQYVRDKDNTDDPDPELCKDYGFAHCNHNRDDIRTLKNIYKMVLERAAPIELHEACYRGKLVAFAKQLGVQIEPQHWRLMQNIHGYSV